MNVRPQWAEGVLYAVGVVAASIAFILPLRDYPSGDFYQDGLSISWAALAILCALHRFVVSRTVVLFALIVLYILVSGVVNPPYYYDVWLAPALCIGLFTLLVSGIQALTLPVRERLLWALCVGLLLGGSFSLLLCIAQFFGVSELLGPLVFPGGTGIYANLGQRNMLASYLLLTAVAWAFIAARKAVPGSVAALIMWTLSFGVSATASRMVFVDCLLLLGLVWFWFYRNREDQCVARFVQSLTLLCLGVAFFQGVLALGDDGGSARIVASGDIYRLNEWAKAWQIFIDHPLGVGFGHYARYSFLYQLDSAVPGQITWVHAHNLLLQVLVEFGLWALPMFLAGGWLYGRFFLRTLKKGLSIKVAFLCLTLLLVHSLLEYPLWYMNFLLLFFIFAGLGTVEQLSASERPFWPAKVMAFCVLLIAVTTMVSYSRMPGYRLLDRSVTVNMERLVDLLELSVHPLLAWPADKLLVDYLPPESGPEQNYNLCKAIHMAIREPLYPYLERVALLALAGHQFDLASSVLKSRYQVYPELPDSYLKGMIEQQWSDSSARYIAYIEAEKKVGFAAFPAYRLTLPESCR